MAWILAIGSLDHDKKMQFLIRALVDEGTMPLSWWDKLR